MEDVGHGKCKFNPTKLLLTKQLCRSGSSGRRSYRNSPWKGLITVTLSSSKEKKTKQKGTSSGRDTVEQALAFLWETRKRCLKNRSSCRIKMERSPRAPDWMKTHANMIVHEHKCMHNKKTDECCSVGPQRDLHKHKRQVEMNVEKHVFSISLFTEYESTFIFQRRVGDCTMNKIII